MLRRHIQKSFFVSNCDIVIDADYADIAEFHKAQKNKITIITSMKNFTIPYGVCGIRKGGALKEIREKPQYHFLVNTGMYILEKSVLSDIPKNRPYNMIELIDGYLKRRLRVGVYPVSERSWVDIGQ